MGEKPLKIYIIAGEASGDRLGADAMRQIKSEFGSETEFYGIAGPLMQAEGMQSLFPMEELSIMGVFEIVPRLIHILKRIQQTILNIEEINPDAILTIDAPDFSFRVQKGIKTRNHIQAKQLHYVAPTVWAWRPKRAQKVASFLDGMLCLFPFEPEYFEKEGLKAAFVGHPVVNSGLLEADGNVYREAAGITQSEKTLGVFLGSRRGEIKRHGAILSEALRLMQRDNPRLKLHVITPTLPHLKDQVFQTLKTYDGALHVSSDPDMKWHAFKACDTAIAVSGTIGLELAIAGVPHLIAYKMNALTAALAKRMVTVKYAHLANIMMDEAIIPEFIQENCKPDIIADMAQNLLSDNALRAEQKQQLSAIQSEVTPPAEGTISGFIKGIL